jgi:hypothetical protein
VTLVVSLISESWAIQVSDRRLVYVGPDGTVVRRDDGKNKAILWCNRLAFSYTGLGELGPGREGTDAWLARELAAWWGEEDRRGQDQGAVIDAIGKRAEVAIRRLTESQSVPRALLRHIFSGVGWAQFDGRGGLVPYIVDIHNEDAQAQDGIGDNFSRFVHRLPEGENPIVVRWVGQELGAEEERLGDLRQVDPASKEFGPFAAEVLAGIVRAVAATNGLVGRGLLINALPKWAIHPGSGETILLAGGPMWEQLTFLYVPSDDDDPVVRGPLYVCEGRQMSGFEAWGPSAEEIGAVEPGTQGNPAEPSG